jgi:hypothetical protein
VTDHPRPGEVDTILARARTRRRRHATALLGGTAGLLLVVAVAAGAVRPRSDAELEPAGRVRGTGTTRTAAPEPARPGSATVPPRRPGHPAASTAVSRPGAPAAQDAAVPVPPANGGEPAPRRYAARPLVAGSTATGKGASCRNRVIDPSHPASWIASGAWCVRFTMSYYPNENVFLPEIEVCRDVDDVAASLSFRTGQEVEFAVRAKSGVEVWRWSRGQVFARDAHTVSVGRGDCFVWTFTYDATDDYGRRLPRGDYVLRGAVVTPEFHGRSLDMDVPVS